MSYEIEASGPGVFVKDDSIETFFTLAANAGVDIRLTQKLSLNLGYRYLYIDARKTELLGSTFHLDDFKSHLVTAGLNIRF